MQANGIEPIDLVVVNLYPFESTVAQVSGIVCIPSFLFTLIDVLLPLRCCFRATISAHALKISTLVALLCFDLHPRTMPPW